MQLLQDCDLFFDKSNVHYKPVRPTFNGDIVIF